MPRTLALSGIARNLVAHSVQVIAWNDPPGRSRRRVQAEARFAYILAFDGDFNGSIGVLQFVPSHQLVDLSFERAVETLQHPLPIGSALALVGPAVDYDARHGLTAVSPLSTTRPAGVLESVYGLWRPCGQ